MGVNISATVAVWISFSFALVISFSTNSDQRLLKELGLNVLPDISKINISTEEYTRMMDSYLRIRRNSADGKLVPKLVTFSSENESYWWMKRQSTVLLQFPISTSPRVEVESAELRMLVPPQKDGSTTVRVQVNLVVSPRQKHLLAERTFYLSMNQSKWCSTDVTAAVKSWMSGNRNLGLELVCLDVNCNLKVSNVAITTLMYSDSNRVRRSSPYQSVRRTDCQKGKRKRKCCRQNMKVNFTKLNFPELDFIIEPKQYEAGYCHGLCPPNYNHATNHSRIQSLMHQMDKSNTSKSPKKRIVPKTCCVPSKLESLDILLISKDDPTKLVVEKWDNMIVNECACS